MFGCLVFDNFICKPINCQKWHIHCKIVGNTVLNRRIPFLRQSFLLSTDMRIAHFPNVMRWVPDFMYFIQTKYISDTNYFPLNKWKQIKKSVAVENRTSYCIFTQFSSSFFGMSPIFLLQLVAWLRLLARRCTYTKLLYNNWNWNIPKKLQFNHFHRKSHKKVALAKSGTRLSW